MSKEAVELRRLLDQAHETMQVQLIGLARLKRERNFAEGLCERTLKALLPIIGTVESPELLAVYGALEDHMKVVDGRRRG